MKNLVAVCVLAAGVALSGLPAQETLSLDQITEQALRNNLDLASAYDALREAEENLGWTSELSSSRISVNGSYGYSPDAPDPHSLSGQVSVSVPVTAQLSLSGSITSRETGSLSVNLSPFTSGGGDYRSEQTYERALVQAEYQRARLPFSVEAAVFSVLEAQTNLAISRAKLDLEEQSYAISEQTYALRELSYEELEEERSSLLSARQSAFDTERALLNAEIGLYKLLGPSEGEIAPAEVSAEELARLLAERESELAAMAGRDPGSMTLATLRIDLEALQAERSQTWAYRPNLSISASVSYPFSASGSVSLSFSPGDLKGDEREDLIDAIEETQQEIQLELLSVDYQQRMLERALEIADQVLEVRRTEVEQAETALAEARLLREQGERTQVELEQARLSLDTARMRLFAAVADCIAATNDLILTYVL